MLPPGNAEQVTLAADGDRFECTEVGPERIRKRCSPSGVPFRFRPRKTATATEHTPLPFTNRSAKFIHHSFPSPAPVSRPCLPPPTDHWQIPRHHPRCPFLSSPSRASCWWGEASLPSRSPAPLLPHRPRRPQTRPLIPHPFRKAVSEKWIAFRVISRQRIDCVHSRFFFHPAQKNNRSALKGEPVVARGSAPIRRPRRRCRHPRPGRAWRGRCAPGVRPGRPSGRSRKSAGSSSRCTGLRSGKGDR